MDSGSFSDSKKIVYRQKSYSAVACRTCGAKMYPKSLLAPHLDQHQRDQRWYRSALNSLQDTFSRMQDIV